MKRILLTGALLATLSSFGQAVLLGTGAYDDFNQVAEYGTTEGGIYWFEDVANPNDYELTRSGTQLSVAVTKGGTYSPFGFGFGDDNGPATGGNKHYIDISATKTLTFDMSVSDLITASSNSPGVTIQLEDASGKKLEISATRNMPSGEKVKLGVNPTTSIANYSISISDAELIDADADGIDGGNGGSCGPDQDQPCDGWVCAAWPTDCPATLATSNFDFTKVTQLMFFVRGGGAYTGTVTIDNVILGATEGTPGVTSTTDASIIAGSKLYPNPTSSETTLELNLQTSAAVKVVLTDVLGKEVMTITEGNFSATSKTFSTSNLNKGVYNVSYVVNGNVAKTELLMVK